ncbi:MAG TPA: FAD binding domain-containing protein [Thermoanaerobaculia bacterium]|nr:FAD binding domain-containing protein [Thermoanaerobaculia bacterium]
MKPAPFAYHAARSAEEAVGLLAQYGGEAKVLAGGQSLVPVMSFRLAQPAALVDVNPVSELDFLEDTAAGGLRIGALVRLRRLERDPRVAARAPLLAAALPHVAHPQIRTRGTAGGSIAHADPAAELPCLAVALDARLRLVGPAGERWVEAREFFFGLFATALEPDELLAEIELPPRPPGEGWAFLEIARRHGDYAQVGVAARLVLGSDGRVAAARLVYLSVGDAPMEATRAAASLVGEAPGPAAFAAAAALAASEEIDPAGDIHASAEFKRHLTRVLTARALTAAAVRAGRETA